MNAADDEGTDCIVENHVPFSTEDFKTETRKDKGLEVVVVEIL